MIMLWQFIVALLIAPAVHGVMKQIRARLSRRPGPPIVQPYRDMRKLWGKEALAPSDASVLFTLAPAVLLGISATVLWLVPTVFATDRAAIDIISIALMLALGRFLLVLAALDCRSAFTAMAATREVTFAALTEAPMILALVSASLAHPTPLAETLAAGALILVMLAETARIPIDNQETHYELTMIHEGLLLEYSGWQLALVQLSAYVRQLAFFILIASLLPGDGIVKIAWILGLVVTIPVVERILPKLRLFEVPGLFTTATLLAFAAIGLRIVGVIAW